MIAGQFFDGSGLGDMLFRYITSRCLALDKGFDHGMYGLKKFKGASFMQLPPTIDMDMLEGLSLKKWDERDIRVNGVDTRSFDPESQFVEDNTIVDGCFEDSKYWMHHLDEIREWLKVEPLEMPEDLCIIGSMSPVQVRRRLVER